MTWPVRPLHQPLRHAIKSRRLANGFAGSPVDLFIEALEPEEAIKSSGRSLGFGQRNYACIDYVQYIYIYIILYTYVYMYTHMISNSLILNCATVNWTVLCHYFASWFGPWGQPWNRRFRGRRHRRRGCRGCRWKERLQWTTMAVIDRFLRWVYQCLDRSAN